MTIQVSRLVRRRKVLRFTASTSRVGRMFVAAITLTMLVQPHSIGQIPTPEGKTMSIALTPSVLPANGAIPMRYTCDGKDISPPLAWRDLPVGTKGVALIVGWRCGIGRIGIVVPTCHP